jgi:hypothetical protein
LSKPLLIRQFLHCILPEDRYPRSLR